MKNIEIVNKITFAANKALFKVKKHSPEILITAGVIGTVASAVMACKATTKLSDILEDTKDQIDQVHKVLEDETVPESKYSEEDGKKDLAIIYAQTGIKLVKLYAPSVALGALSITGIVASNNILRKRNIALGAAFTAMDRSFKEYRGRVIERFGKDLDRELRFNTKAKQIEETVVDENGNESTVTKTVEIVDPNVVHSIYSVVFCEGNTGWTKNAELNKVFLLQQQNYANDKLRLNGVLTLNEVYDMIGAPRTAYGQLAGWVYTEDSSVGDNFVDFGIFDINSEKKCDFINGIERSIILDFNCIGNILDYI